MTPSDNKENKDRDLKMDLAEKLLIYTDKRLCCRAESSGNDHASRCYNGGEIWRIDHHDRNNNHKREKIATFYYL
jgi:hypothetical protein